MIPHPVFTHDFSRRADMFAVTAAEFTAKGTANVLPTNESCCGYARLPSSPTTGSSTLLDFSPPSVTFWESTRCDHQFISTANQIQHFLKCLRFPSTRRQNDWNIILPHIKFVYHNSFSQTTGLARNEIRIGRPPRFPLSLLDHPKIKSGHHNLDQDNGVLKRSC